MDNQNRHVYKTDVLIPATKKRVWNIITDLARLTEVTGLEAHGSVERTDTGEGTGDITLGSLPYKLRYRPYDFELHSRELKIGIRFTETWEGCRAYAVSVGMSESAKNYAEALVGMIFENLASIAKQQIAEETAAQKAAAANRAAPVKKPAQGDPEPQKQPQRRSYEPRQRPRPEKEPAANPYTAPESPKKRQPAPAAEPSAPKPAKKSRGRTSVLSWVMLAAAVGLIVLAVMGVGRLAGRIGDIFTSRDDANVTLSVVESIELGMKKQEVAALLGSSGDRRGDDVLYSSQWGPMVLVRYGDEGAYQVIYKDPETSADPDADRLIDPAADLTAAVDVSSAQALLGLGVSEVRKSAEGLELCFGFCDPYASFDESWMPEYSLYLNADGSKALVRNWDYTSALPYVVKELEGTPLQYQYSELGHSVQDMYGYLSALKLLNNYSRGDIENVLGGTLVQYQNIASMTLCSLELKDPVATMPVVLEDGSTGEGAAYSISVSLNDGYFRSASYTNTRIWKQSGMLRGSDYQRLTRGMSMAEAQQVMGILPSAFFYDTTSLYLCYGRYIETDVLEEQFEYIVRINVAGDVVTNIYDNAAVAAAEDAPPAPTPEEASAEGEAAP